MNWCNMTLCAFDYAADARGNSWGIALEYYRDDWVLRFGHFAQPQLANQLPLDGAFFKHYGQNFEIEHAHELDGQPGKLRLLVFRNTAVMGGYADALDYAASNGGTPDTANTLRERVKYGAGLNLEQAVTPALGMFARAMWQDGESDTYAFTEVHRSLAAGVAIKGEVWGRERDNLGIALMRNAISGAYQRYLEAGGSGFFIGDGKLNYHPEQILEGYYSWNVARSLWLSADYQYMRNPAYNADRGPVSIAGVRLHWES
jgi:carbohydrate-selective porin OprB